MRKIKKLPDLMGKASMLRVVQIKSWSSGVYEVTVENNAEIKKHQWHVRVMFPSQETVIAECDCYWFRRSYGNVVGCSHTIAALYALGERRQRKLDFFGTRAEAEASHPEKILRLVSSVSKLEREDMTIYITSRAA